MLCAICRFESPKYKCPKCEIEYCSLGCYKKHGCSELFYKQNVEETLKSTKTDKPIQQLLWDLHHQEEERLFDLEAPNLLEQLTIDERKDFERLIQSPEGIQRLLGDTKQWWETDTPRAVEIKKIDAQVLPNVVFAYIVMSRTHVEMDQDAFETFRSISYLYDHPMHLYQSVQDCLDLMVSRARLAKMHSSSIRFFLEDLVKILELHAMAFALSKLQEMTCYCQQ
ncbi:hypothetical protein EDD86DRAFT_250294 [Gorgonomyces haynaldii]|nr:hypothetical protein EDD86DRAFT_250294 [Gorgonomyces haynaldii]